VVALLRRGLIVAGLVLACVVSSSAPSWAANVSTTLANSTPYATVPVGGHVVLNVSVTTGIAGYNVLAQSATSTGPNVADCSGTYITAQQTMAPSGSPTFVTINVPTPATPGYYCYRASHPSQVIGADTYTVATSALASVVRVVEQPTVQTEAEQTALLGGLALLVFLTAGQFVMRMRS